jgi:hypothetical protein
MSKQSEVKKRQGYTDRAIPQVCMNCASFSFEIGCHGGNPEYPREMNFRCRIGGFAVKKMGTCDEFSGKEDQPTPTNK